MDENRYRVVISDPIAPEAADLLEESGCDVRICHGDGKGTLDDELRTAQALIVRSQTKVTAAMMDRAPQLKIVARAGSGYDNIDVAAATQRGIAVINAPGANSVAAAELTLALMMALLRNVVPANRSVSGGKWERQQFIGNELFGKTLGVVGLGRIGQLVAQRALAFEMQVIAYDAFVPAETFARFGVEKVDYDELLRRSDVITFHVPKGPETHHMFDESALDQCKKGMWIVNCARGGVVSESALLAGLQSGKIAGAAVDVFEQEPPGGSALLQLDNVLATPHIGALSRESQTRVARETALAVADYLREGTLRNLINPEYQKR